jgi:hypothetical protein
VCDAKWIKKFSGKITGWLFSHVCDAKLIKKFSGKVSIKLPDYTQTHKNKGTYQPGVAQQKRSLNPIIFVHLKNYK